MMPAPPSKPKGSTALNLAIGCGVFTLALCLGTSLLFSRAVDSSRQDLLANAIAQRKAAARRESAAPLRRMEDLGCRQAFAAAPEAPSPTPAQKEARRAKDEAIMKRLAVLDRLPFEELLKSANDEELNAIFVNRFPSLEDLKEPTPAELRYEALLEFEAEVNNGGLDQYFFNSTGNRAHLVREALADWGSPDMRAVFACALEAFPDSSPSANSVVREAQLRSTWGKHDIDVMSPMTKAVYRLMFSGRWRYDLAPTLRKQPSDFPSVHAARQSGMTPR